jgi:glutathione peroxidase-family protein
MAASAKRALAWIEKSPKSFVFKTLAGKTLDMNTIKDKVVLIVNTATL